jgi:cytidyltransferase-like protein
MTSDNLKPMIKAAYLLQLRHGPFTPQEFSKFLGVSDASQHVSSLLSQGYLTEHADSGEQRYSLTEKGRAQIKVVLAGGVYDVLHLGHLAALTEAKTLGDVLVAVVATDITVEMLKSRKPIFPEKDRRALVEGIKPVDKAILGYEDVGMGYEQVLIDVMPDIVAFGYDQVNLEKSVREIIERHNLRIQTVKLSKFDHEKYLSSTSVRQKLSEELR